MATTQSTKLELLLGSFSVDALFTFKEFMRALLIEALANTNFTFDELNYGLYASDYPRHLSLPS